MPLFTLTSDFNLQSYYTAILKKKIVMAWGSNASIIETTHNIPAFNLLEASYVCGSILYDFPINTFHIILVDMFDKFPNSFVIAHYRNQFFIAPDNGLLPMTFKNDDVKYYTLPILITDDNKNLEVVFEAITTAMQRLEIDNIVSNHFEETTHFDIKRSIIHKTGENWLDGQIISIDSFENVILNITQQQFEEKRNGRKFKIELLRNEILDEIKKSYADVPEGEKLAFFNHAGYLEIAINKGNAAGLLGFLGKPSENNYNLSAESLFYKSIRIYFE